MENQQLKLWSVYVEDEPEAGGQAIYAHTSEQAIEEALKWANGLSGYDEEFLRTRVMLTEGLPEDAVSGKPEERFEVLSPLGWGDWDGYECDSCQRRAWQGRLEVCGDCHGCEVCGCECDEQTHTWIPGMLAAGEVFFPQLKDSRRGHWRVDSVDEFGAPLTVVGRGFNEQCGYLQTSMEIAKAEPVVEDLATRLILRDQANDNPARDALDEIARICHCSEWEYPGQVVRDVKHLEKWITLDLAGELVRRAKYALEHATGRSPELNREIACELVTEAYRLYQRAAPEDPPRLEHLWLRVGLKISFGEVQDG